MGQRGKTSLSEHFFPGIRAGSFKIFLLFTPRMESGRQIEQSILEVVTTHNYDWLIRVCLLTKRKREENM